MFGRARLDADEHVSRDWRIHELARDFAVLDVWALPTPGGRDDFDDLVARWRTFDPARTSLVVRALFAIRWSLGRVLGLDRPATGLGHRVPTLRDRLTDDLRCRTTELECGRGPFVHLYRTADECALEIANRTVHGVLHLGWVADGTGAYRGQLAVLVKPNGALGRAYLVAIAPFRHLIVYPLVLRDVGRRWRARHGADEHPKGNPMAHNVFNAAQVRQIAPGVELRASRTLGRVDYADAFEVDLARSRERSAEGWMRALLDGAPLRTRLRLLAGWSSIGLRLRIPGAQHSILGWDIRDGDDDFVLLGARSRIGMPGELLLRRRGAGLLFSTRVRHDNPFVRRLWATIEPSHVTTVRSLLDRL